MQKKIESRIQNSAGGGNARRLLFGLLTSLVSLAGAGYAQTYDLVLANGRVMDPDSKLDAVRHVGIRDGRIEAVSEDELSGESVLDVSGLVVAPGFIDLHAHGQDEEARLLHAGDGVTMALELEVGTNDVDAWYAEQKGKAPIHYGVSVGHIPVRMQVMDDPGSWLPTGDAASRPATEEELKDIIEGLRAGLDAGAPAVGLGIQYTPGATRKEILEVFRLASGYGVPCHVHIRYMSVTEPGSSVEGVEEVIAAAAATGAPLHVVHITSSSLKDTPICTEMLLGAADSGLDLTVEAYPYTAASTRLESALFDPGWQEKLGIGYDGLEWVETGERLTEATFKTYREQGGFVIIHMIPEEAADFAVGHPKVIIGSDGMPFIDGKGHPRGAGSFARVLGLYSREKKLMPLMTALRKMTIMPADRLEDAIPEMERKGRVQVGADADITVFDPETVIDRATFENPVQTSAGIYHVLVNGTFVVKEGKLVKGVYPGEAVRRGGR